METSCSVREFPIEYSPVDYNFFGVTSVPLGDEVTLASYAADDSAGRAIADSASGIAHTRFLDCRQTPQSVVLYDPTGRRKVYTDLKDMQELSAPADILPDDADAYCLCNINFARSLLPAAKASGKPIFTDVHCLSDVHDEYNADFMRCADVLFLSNENIKDREEEFAHALAAEYPCSVIAVGMGDMGALLYERSSYKVSYSPAVYTRPVVNTIGAGDALFSAFVHFYLKGEQPLTALQKAVFFASYKTGESGASKGFLTEDHSTFEYIKTKPPEREIVIARGFAPWQSPSFFSSSINKSRLLIADGFCLMKKKLCQIFHRRNLK